MVTFAPHPSAPTLDVVAPVVALAPPEPPAAVPSPQPTTKRASWDHVRPFLRGWEGRRAPIPFPTRATGPKWRERRTELARFPMIVARAVSAHRRLAAYGRRRR